MASALASRTHECVDAYELLHHKSGRLHGGGKCRSFTWKNIKSIPIWVLCQQPRLKQSVQEAISSLMRLNTVLSCRLGCLKALISWWKVTSARISYHSCWTRGSVVRSWRSLLRVCNASELRPFDTSHRGENGRNNMPNPSTSPGINWSRNGSRQAHSPAMY